MQEGLPGDGRGGASPDPMGGEQVGEGVDEPVGEFRARRAPNNPSQQQIRMSRGPRLHSSVSIDSQHFAKTLPVSQGAATYWN